VSDTDREPSRVVAGDERANGGGGEPPRPRATTAFDRSAPPAAGAPTPFRFPPFVHRPLLPGIDLYAARVTRAPMVSLELILARGGQADPVGGRGLASLTGDLLDEGTARHSGPELAAWVERLGGSASSTADWDATYIACTLLAEHLDHGLELLAEMATAPTFPPPELERLRKRRLAELLRRRSSPGALAEERFAHALYGDGPYGYPMIGNEVDLAQLDDARCRGFYDAVLRRAGATLIATGDLDPEAVAARAETLLAGWPALEPLSVTPITPRALPSPELHVVDRPDASQTELRLGHAGPPRNHPDRVPLSVLNSLLGGKFISRINLNLRERHGYTYGAHSSFANRRGPGPFQVSAAVQSESVGAAVREVLAELRRLREEPVPAEELADAVRYLEGVFPYTLQTVESVAHRLSQLAVFALADDYFADYFARLQEVTSPILQQVAQRHLRPEACAIVAVGPASSLLPQLEPFGEVSVWSATGERIAG
jgi:zinc protease